MSSVKWFVDKESKIPLYLQLKALAKHYISTGMIRDKEKLPTVKNLAKQLGINFETIRKAYKDLEQEGLLSTTRGRGTFANGHIRVKSEMLSPVYPEMSPVDAFKNSIRSLLKANMTLQEIQNVFTEVVDGFESETGKELVLFTECNELQIREISSVLKQNLKFNVRPVLLTDLRKTVEKILQQESNLLSVVTTGFHVNEVKNQLSDLAVKVDFVITNMSSSTRRALESFDKNARFGLIGRDPVQLHFFKDLVKSELLIQSEIFTCSIEDKVKTREIVNSVDVLLYSPPVYEEIKKLVSPSLPIFNVFDQVDPISLRQLIERLETYQQ